MKTSESKTYSYPELRNSTLLLTIFFLTLISVGPSGAQSLTEPSEIVTTIVDRHPGVKRADLLVRAAEFEVKGSRLQPNPTLTVAATAGDAGESANALTQNFEVSGQPHLRWRIATAKLKAAQQDRRAIRRQITAQAYRNWLSLWKAQRLMDLAELRVTLMQETLRVAQRRFEVGEIAQNEALRVELAATQAEGAQARARSELAGAGRSLEILVGAELKESQLNQPGSLIPAELKLVDAMAAVEVHPDILAKNYQYEALKSGAALTGKQRAPILGLSIYRAHLFRPGMVEQGAQLSLSWPLFDWGRIDNRKKQQEARAEAYAAGVEEDLLTGRQEVSRLWARLTAAKTNRELLTTQSARYEELARETRIAYDLGMLSLTDVFQTEASFRSARVRLVEAQAEVLELEVQLLEFTGLPWPEPFLKEES